VLSPGDPKRSRVAALDRVRAILETVPGGETNPMRNTPISDLGIGLTYNQLRDQTIRACEESKRIEADRRERFEAKMRKYNIS